MDRTILHVLLKRLSPYNTLHINDVQDCLLQVVKYLTGVETAMDGTKKDAFDAGYELGQLMAQSFNIKNDPIAHQGLGTMYASQAGYTDIKLGLAFASGFARALGHVLPKEIDKGEYPGS